MADDSASPRLIKFVRRALRREPGISFEQLLERWRVQHPEPDDEDLLRRTYDKEQGTSPGAIGRDRDPNHNRTVLLTVVAWVLANTALALLIGLPGYIQCTPRTGSGLFSCGLNLGIVFLAVGAGQVVYGAMAAVVASRFGKAVTQGLLIGMGAVFLLFGAVCFGATIKG